MPKETIRGSTRRFFLRLVGVAPGAFIGLDVSGENDVSFTGKDADTGDNDADVPMSIDGTRGLAIDATRTLLISAAAAYQGETASWTP